MSVSIISMIFVIGLSIALSYAYGHFNMRFDKLVSDNKDLTSLVLNFHDKWAATTKKVEPKVEKVIPKVEPVKKEVPKVEVK